MPLTVTPQPCEICGKETTQRCSACATTGVDLFSCSKEHQKLRNCRPGKANPFFIPPLTDEELASLKERAHLPVMMTALVPSTISYDFAKVSGHSFEYVLEHIGGPVFDTQHLPMKVHLVGMVRNSRLAHPSQLANPVMSTDSLLSSFSGVVFTHLCAAQLLPDNLVEAPWFTPLHHKLLFVADLTAQVFFSKDGKKDDSDKREAAKCLLIVQRRTDDWVRDGMGTNDPRFRSVLAHITFDVLEGCIS
ncbi:hypothetical protein JCM10449v2_003506 [Rhodotorula kratochvilovae]